MLLGLLAAVMLAVLLQLNARRSQRTDGVGFACDGIIHLRCWVVVEAPACVASRPASILALAAPRRQPEPLRFVGEMRMLMRPPAPKPAVRTPQDVIIIPGKILQAIIAAEEIGASIWQSPPSLGRNAMTSRSMAAAASPATLH